MLGGAHGVEAPFTPWIYAVQWLALAFSTNIFALAVLQALARELPASRRVWLAAGATIIVVTNPLVAHFAVSLMTDSLASSFTIAVIGAFSMAFCTSSLADFLRTRWLALGLGSLLLVALSRVDKLYLAAMLCIVTLAWCWRQPRVSRSPARWIVTPLLLMAGALVVAGVVNKATQTYNPARPPIDLSSMAFNRVVWPRLSKVYPYLSPEDQRVISLKDAVHFDEHNNAFPLISRVLTEDLANRHVLNDITKVTLQRFPRL